MWRTLLALDCATRGAAVVLRCADGRSATRVVSGRGRQAEQLLPMLDEALASLELTPAELDAFALTVGPGSFTSLRVAVATIKGLAFGSAAPVAAVSTLQADAWTARSVNEQLPVAAVLDAQRGDWYAGSWRVAPGARLDPLLAESLYTPEALAAELPRGCRIAGESPAALRECLARLGRSDLVWVEADPAGAARAEAVAALGEALIADDKAVSAADLVPRYFRRAEAEAQRLGQPLEDAL